MKGWQPPAGAVVVQAGPAISCAACGVTENAGTARNAIRMRDRHRCPAGTVGAFPVCPTCDASGPRCYYIDGAVAPEWHPAREALWKAARP